MRRDEHFRAAVVAEPEEIQQLNDYLARRVLTKGFSKRSRESCYGLDVKSSARNAHQMGPYHYLRTDLTLLLGAGGSKLLNNTWSKFQLSPNERNPEKLRPCLMKLFSVAARIAAPKGVGHALKRLVSDFEKVYFPVAVTTENDQQYASRRFALLAVLQSGGGGHLLHGILEDPRGQQQTVTRARNSYPSGHIEQDPTLARRQFLFEAAFRAKSWSEAYRQARLLKAEAPQSERYYEVNRRLSRVYDGMLASGCSAQKKKQLSTDLAACFDFSKNGRLGLTLQALGSRAPTCRPGDAEKTALDLLHPGDPWWKSSLSRLYRHLPVPERWMDDMRTLCQAEPSLRGFCRVILNIVRLSEARASASLTVNGLSNCCFTPDKHTSQARLRKVRQSVREWQKLLPPMESSHPERSGTDLVMNSEGWRFITEVCTLLGVEAPLSTRARRGARPTMIERIGTRKVLFLTPEFPTLPPGEQRFLIAQCIFREAAGLDLLEARALEISTPTKLSHHALSYAEWMGHSPSPFAELPETRTREQVLVALEDMYWDTGDNAYLKLAQYSHQGGWCPLFDREADLFAAAFSDLVSSSQALVRGAFWSQQLAQVCSKEGLVAILQAGRDCPVLCLRLQNLWLSVADEVQRNRYQMKFLANSR